MKQTIAVLAMMAALGAAGQELERIKTTLLDSPTRQTLYPYVYSIDNYEFAYIDFGRLDENIAVASTNYAVLSPYGQLMFIDPREFCNPVSFAKLKQMYTQDATIQLLSFDRNIDNAPVRNPRIVYPGDSIEDTVIEERFEVSMPELPTNVMPRAYVRPVSQLYKMDPKTGEVGERMGLITYAHDQYEGGPRLVITYEGDDPRVKNHRMTAVKIDRLLPPKETVEFVGRQRLGIFTLPSKPGPKGDLWRENFPEPAYGTPLFSTYIPEGESFFKRLDIPIVIGDFNREL